MKFSRLWLWLPVGTAVLTLSIGIFLWRAWSELNAPLDLTGRVTFEVPAGTSLASVSNRLADNGWLEHPRLFSGWARLTGSAAQLQAGEYQLEPGTSPRQLLEKLISGEVKQYQVTLLEGWTFHQALEAIWSSPGISITLTEQPPAAIAGILELPVEQPEGLLFPDTYFYTRGTTDLDILRRAHQRLAAILEDAWQSRTVGLPFDTAYEALILASIVEKETAVADERTQVSGVFIRRLEQNMRLQSDPTVIYGMGDDYNGNIDRAALNEVTPYNTYRVNGLPPTPIALAGRESIRASVNPDLADTLYFVSRGDGSHQFSATLEEHNAAVRLYQLGEDAR